MESDCKRKKQPRSEKKKESCEKRSPLQNLNGLPFHKRNSKKSSNLSSSSSAYAVSAADPKICLSSLLSSNSCTSPSSSCSRFNLDKKSKTFSNLARSEPNKSTADSSKVLLRSKENEVSRKPFLQKSGRNQPQSLTRREYGKSYSKPVFINGRRSKLSSVLGNPENKLKKGSQEFQAKTKNSRENGPGKPALDLLGVSNSSNSNCSENCTPMGRVDSLNFGDHETVTGDSIYEIANSKSGSDAKTPPVEASSSPEIQSHSHSKMLVLKSAATPICYGAGHLVSGVTDKRKCRRRGSLRGGPEKFIIFDDERGDEDVINDLKKSPIPLLAEGSFRWHLSPSNEGCEDHRIDSGNRLDLCRMACDDDDLLFSHSKLCGNESDSLCADSSYSGSDSVGNVAHKRRKRNVILSPRKATEFHGLLEPLNCNMVESLLVTSPSAAYSCNDISSRDEKHLSENLAGDNSKLSIGSLSSGNIIQTPDSESDVCVGRSRLEVHQSNFVWPELDSITETLERVNLSPRNEMPIWNGRSLGFHLPAMASPLISDDPTQLQKNVDSVSSWVSDTTFSNLSLSQMRISWRDGLGSRTVETEEFDCCCILSDDDIDADESASEQKMLHPLTEATEDRETHQDKSCRRTHLGIESGVTKENYLRMGNDLSPVLLDYEPCISTRAKERSLSHRTDARAESICTDGGGLVASDDSDWTYFHEDHLFQGK